MHAHRQGAGAFRPDVAGDRPLRRGCSGSGEGINLHQDLQRRKPVLHARVPPLLPKPRRRRFMVDVPWNGFSQSKKIGDLAEVYQLNVAPHNYYSHLSSFISASLCAVLPNVRIMETDVDDVPWKDELVTRLPRIAAGHMKIPSGPWLGRRSGRGGVEEAPVGKQEIQLVGAAPGGRRIGIRFAVAAPAHGPQPRLDGGGWASSRLPGRDQDVGSAKMVYIPPRRFSAPAHRKPSNSEVRICPQ